MQYLRRSSRVAAAAALTVLVNSLASACADEGTSALDVSTARRLGQPIPSVKSLADLVPGSVDFFDVEGCRAFLIRPEVDVAPAPMPWVWYAPVIGHPNTSHAWMLRQWLAQGIGMAGVDVGESYGSPRGRKVFTALLGTLTTRYGMSERPCLLPQSRGGLMLYNWAAENPERMACIAGIYTVCDLLSYPGLEKASGAYGMRAADLEACLAQHNPIDRLAPLAKAGVPILHVHGDADHVVPLEENSGELAHRYRALGGQVRLIIVRGKGHQVCPEFFQCQELVDFVIAHAKPPVPAPRGGLLVYHPGDSLAYLTDFCLDSQQAEDELVEFLHGCRTVIWENNFRDSDVELARNSRHMVSADVGRLAARVQPEALVLFHVSDRYGEEEWREQLAEVRRQFDRAVFPNQWRLSNRDEGIRNHDSD